MEPETFKMMAVIIITIITCICLVLIVLFIPTVKIKKFNLSIYWIAVLVGALIILCTGLLSFKEAWKGLTANTSINPLKIIGIFISMTILSIFLDELNFFKYLANETLKRAKTSQIKLFIYLLLSVSLLTIFTSNDIIILTFTPFLCYFSKNANIDPIPYLVAEFVSANTWSMMLIIGNPTNIYLATSCGINFIQYLKVMVVPTIFGGITSVGVLLLLFYKRLLKPIDPVVEDVIIKDKILLWIGIVHLSICTILLVISSYIKIEMWIITLSFAGSLIIVSLIYKIFRKSKPKELIKCLKRAPWELIPFIISMFILVLALDKYNVTTKIGNILKKGEVILNFGISSIITANIINNIPMSVLFTSITKSLDEKAIEAAVYASIVGSNIGAFLTPVGALAGIMFTNILKKHETKFSFLDFLKYGCIIAIPTLFATLGGLYIFY